MSKWRNSIDIKQYLTEDESNENVNRICKLLIPQLERILKLEKRHYEQKENKQNLTIDDYFLDEFEDCIEQFKFVEECAKGNESLEQYSYDSWCGAFNEYLNVLYDIGDTVVNNTDNFFDRQRFLWIE